MGGLNAAMGQISDKMNDFPIDELTKNIESMREEINIEPLMEKTKIFFKKNGLLLNWKEVDKLDKTQKINTLSMIAPITNEEKQKLLESVSLYDKVNTLGNIINFYLHEVDFNNQTIQ